MLMDSMIILHSLKEKIMNKCQINLYYSCFPSAAPEYKNTENCQNGLRNKYSIKYSIFTHTQSFCKDDGKRNLYEPKCYKIKYLSDGLEIVGFMIKPKRDEKKYPCIIFNRGGGGEASKMNNRSLKDLIYLSSNNYVVLASQYRGIDGGQGRIEFGGKDVNDVLNLIETAKSLPFIDPRKIVMLGASRGGMMSYLAIKQGAEILAAAIVAGITDLEQFYDETNPKIQKEIRETVGMDKKEWEMRSAYYWPQEINVPVLILHGELDKSIHVNQSKKLSKRLKREGKIHELVIFPEGDHSLSKHQR